MPPVKKPHRDRIPHFFGKWREHAGLTQDQVVEKLGWSQSKISRLEAGKTPFNQDDLEMAAELYRCSPAELLLVDPTEPNSSAALLLRAMRAPQEQLEQIVSYARFSLNG